MNRKSSPCILIAGGLLLVPCLASAQQWEVGGGAGYAFERKLNVSRDSTAAEAGFKNGFLFSVWGGQDLYRHVGGELRYTYQASNLQLSQDGTKVGLTGDSHAIHYDFLFNATPRESRVRPFVAAGAGIRFFRGTEDEPVYQPLSEFAVLTRTEQVKPLISLGGGVRVKLSRHAQFRLDFRDYMSPFPKQVIAPVPGAKLKGWLHDFVPIVGIGLVF